VYHLNHVVTHCSNSYIALEAKQHTSPSSGKQNLTASVSGHGLLPQKIKMALIYKKPPLAPYNKGWNKKTLPKETCKMQNKDTRSKMKAKVHIDSGRLGVKFTLDNTIPNQQEGQENPS
jgi:hypothetical protein